MKLYEAAGNVIMSENLVSHKFRVSVNRQSFKLLYGDLYSDKISAVIRELSTNAFDSQKAFGNSDKPFEVHLPNPLEPYFYVKDFGVGLSHDQICGENGIYITFCKSDKTLSDDYTGCLGLGSKSPISYADNFSVESNYNGLRYSYAVFLDADGEPAIAPLGSCPTDEPNGLKVQFAVENGDFQKFADKAARVLSWFKVKPTVLGVTDEFKFYEHQYLRKSDRYGILREVGQSLAVMGNVAYPIDVDDFSYSALTDIEKKVLAHGVHLFVDMGDVEFVPSREHLSYNPKTLEGVKRYLKDAIAALREDLEVQVAQQTSIWKARRMLFDIKTSILGTVRNMGTVVFNGVEISETIHHHELIQLYMPGMERGNANYPKLEKLVFRKERYRRDEADNLPCNGKPIYVNDMEHGGHARIMKHVNEHCNKETVYLLNGFSEEFLEKTGLDEAAVFASKLPKVERQKRGSGGSAGYTKRTVIQQYQNINSISALEHWKDVEVDLADGGVYVVVSYGQVMNEGDTKTHPERLQYKVNAIRNVCPDFKLMGIRPAHLGRLERYKHRWVRLEDYIEKLFKEEYAKVAEVVKLTLQYAALRHHQRYSRLEGFTFSPDSCFGNFMEKYKLAVAASRNSHAKHVWALHDYAKHNVEFTHAVTQELYDMAESLEDTYKLFGMFEWYRLNSEYTASVVDYINGVDARLAAMREAV